MLRNILVLLVLIGVLIGVRAAALLTADLNYVVSPAPGELVYVATFDDFVDDWSVYEGRLSAQARNSAFHLAAGAPESSPFSSVSPHFGDFDLRVIARPVAGPINNGYGVVFRLRDPQNFYWFQISSDGYYQVQRRVDGETKELSTWIESPLIHQGLNVENQLRVIGVGDQFQFFINGEQVQVCVPDDPAGESTYFNECVDGQMLDTLVDDSIPAGQLGVVARTFSEPGVEVEFDNVLVYGPQALNE